MLVDGKLRHLLTVLDSLSHLKRIRIHTRLPIVVPQRITDELIELLRQLRLQVIMVVHTNHAQEIDHQVEASLSKMNRSGMLLFNQSVLLREVNDNVSALVNLSKRLIECNVVPYYLHQLDRVVGAAHFEVPIEQGKQLIEKMRLQLPGYAVPRYVQEIPGMDSKTVLA
jgi:KamA family protein